MKEVILAKIGNAAKALTSKRVYATAAGMLLMSIVESPVAMICTTVIACVYIICETKNKS